MKHFARFLLLGTLFVACGRDTEDDRLALSERAATGRTVYLEKSRPPCGQCHSLRDAGTAGQLGGDLDLQRPSKEHVVRVVVRGIGLMKSQSEILSEDEIDALATYVSEVAGKVPTKS